MAYYAQPSASTSSFVAAGQAPSYTIMISQLPTDVRASDLAELFEHAIPPPSLQHVTIISDARGNSLGMALAAFNKLEQAQDAMTRFHGIIVDSTPLQIQHLLAPGVAPSGVHAPPTAAVANIAVSVPSAAKEQQQSRGAAAQPQRKSLMARLGPSAGRAASPKPPAQPAGLPKKFTELTAIEKKAVLAARQAAAANMPRSRSNNNKPPGASLLARIGPGPSSNSRKTQPAARTKALKQRIDRNSKRMDVD